jgi:NADPH:quinone reductase-like Zn-dependent oxidoreductase
MKAITITSNSGPDALQLQDAPEPSPKDGEAIVRVRAAGVNFADTLMTKGLYYGAPPLPFVPGYELAGEIERVGTGVKGLKEGDRVFSAVPFGGYAEKVAVAVEKLLPIPRGRSFEEAAALPVNYMTAYHALYVLANLRPSSSVLIHAAAGGVGLAAIQLAQLRGARVYGTASRSKHPFLLSRGVEAAIDYRSEDFEQRVGQLTGGRGVDAALDPIGGWSFVKSWRCLAPAGMLVCYGVASGSGGRLSSYRSFALSGLFSPLAMMLRNKGVAGFHLGLLPQELLAWEMSELHKLWDDGKLAPHVGRSFPAEQAAEAHRFLQGRESVGKVVLTF